VLSSRLRSRGWLSRPTWRVPGASRGSTPDLRSYLVWCESRDLDARRDPTHIELYVRWLQEARRYRPSTVSRRMSVVAASALVTGFVCDRRRRSRMLGGPANLSWAASCHAAVRAVDRAEERALATSLEGCHAQSMSRTDSASRVILAGRERVFAALVDADALAAWLPPNGMVAGSSGSTRPDGSYRLVLTYDEGLQESGKTTHDSDIVEARFVEISPHERIVQEVDFVSDEPAFAGTMTMTWELSPESSGTRVEVRADDVPAGISPEDHAAGLESSLAKLAAFVEV
jgi:uncharacterized protein YndB with AHSA1/START domain